MSNEVENMLSADLQTSLPLNVGMVIGMLSRSDVKKYFIDHEIDPMDIRIAEQSLLRLANAFYHKGAKPTTAESFKEALDKLK